jgi:hypothetical protein
MEALIRSPLCPKRRSSYAATAALICCQEDTYAGQKGSLLLSQKALYIALLTTVCEAVIRRLNLVLQREGSVMLYEIMGSMIDEIKGNIMYEIMRQHDGATQSGAANGRDAER